MKKYIKPEFEIVIYSVSECLGQSQEKPRTVSGADNLNIIMGQGWNDGVI